MASSDHDPRDFTIEAVVADAVIEIEGGDDVISPDAPALSAPGRVRVIRARRIVWAVLIAALYLVPQVGGNADYRLAQYEELLSFVVVVIALNIALGYGGQFLIGITAVFEVGGYGTVLVADHHPAGVGLAAMCLIGGAFGAVGGLIIGLPALRVGGFYLAFVSLFAALVIPAVVLPWRYAGASSGVPLYAVPGFDPQITGETLYVVVVSLVLLATIFTWLLVYSRIGHRFAALRTSEQLSTSLGIAGYRTKLLAIFISSAMAGMAGGIYVYTEQFFSPGSTSANFAILLLAAVVIGGTATIWGPLVGGIVILGVNQFFNGFQAQSGIIFGLLLAGFTIFLPNGIAARLHSRNRPGADPMPSHLSPSSTGATPAADAVLPMWSPVIGAGSDEPLRIDGVRRAFGGVVAVDNVELSVQRGTIHGLIGSNGSGKTTLLNLISGFYRLDAGHISIGTFNLEDHPPHSVARVGIARTFQSPKLILNATSLDNVIPAAELRLRCTGFESMLRLPRGQRINHQAHDEALQTLLALGLHNVINEPAAALPHGTRRLVELARAIAMRPSFILLDEPAAGLSPAELDLLIAVIKHLANCGVGVLLIEHNVPMVLDIATDVTVLHQGKRLFQGTPEQLRSDDEVASAFLGTYTESRAAYDHTA